jgi:hypothetical protein
MVITEVPRPFIRGPVDATVWGCRINEVCSSSSP